MQCAVYLVSKSLRISAAASISVADHGEEGSKITMKLSHNCQWHRITLVVDGGHRRLRLLRLSNALDTFGVDVVPRCSANAKLAR